MSTFLECRGVCRVPMSEPLDRHAHLRARRCRLSRAASRLRRSTSPRSRSPRSSAAARYRATGPPAVTEVDIARHYEHLAAANFGSTAAFIRSAAADEVQPQDRRADVSPVRLRAHPPVTSPRRPSRAPSNSCGGFRRRLPRWPGYRPSHCSRPPERTGSLTALLTIPRVSHCTR